MELDRPVWRAIILANAFNGARAPKQREAAATLARPIEQIIIDGQESGEFTKEFSSDSLRKNLEAAYAATASPGRAADRQRFVIFAAQAHGAFQRRVREIVSIETATALFNACPPMVPPQPGGAASSAPTR